MKKPLSFQEQRHSQWNTPKNVLNDLTLEAVDAPIKIIKRIIEGEASEVYAVYTEKKNIIIRISRDQYSPFQRELWALNQVKNLDVPTPTVILITSRQDKGTSLSICIEEMLLGTPLQHILHDLEPLQLKKLIVRSGKILSNIHTVDVVGFGELDENGIGESKTFIEYVLRGNDNQQMIKEISNQIPHANQLITDTNMILAENKNFLALETGKLLHHDYTPKHILIDNNQITGILDFAECRGGDPLQDIARWLYYYPDQQIFEWLKEGYASPDFFDTKANKKILLYNLSLGLSLLVYYFWLKGYDMIPYHIDKLRENISSWKTNYE